MGQIEDISDAVTMDAKQAGNIVFLIGITKNELGGSHFSLVNGLRGGQVPTVDAALAKRTFVAIHQAIRQRLVRSCHDLSEGGLAVAATEMAMAGGLGMTINIDSICEGDLSAAIGLFSESNTRFLVEVTPNHADEFQNLLSGSNVPIHRLGTIVEEGRVMFRIGTANVLDVSTEDAKSAWLRPLDW